MHRVGGADKALTQTKWTRRCSAQLLGGARLLGMTSFGSWMRNLLDKGSLSVVDDNWWAGGARQMGKGAVQ
jgi:hypothetical protein